MGEMIELDARADQGRFAAYLARPQQGAKAAVIVVQELFGVNAGIRRTADAWAARGYLALAPDMFWRFAPGYDVDPEIPEQLEQAIAQRDRIDLDKAVADLETAIRHVRGLDCEKVGVVGFCWGGSMAYLAATRTDADASVGYYGRLIADHLNDAHAIARPLMLHFGGDDPTIPAAMRAAVADALKASPRVTIYDYAGAGHGFAAAFGKRRDAAAAALADARTEAFFAEHLA